MATCVLSMGSWSLVLEKAKPDFSIKEPHQELCEGLTGGACISQTHHKANEQPAAAKGIILQMASKRCSKSLEGKLGVSLEN